MHEMYISNNIVIAINAAKKKPQEGKHKMHRYKIVIKKGQMSREWQRDAVNRDL